MCFRGGGWCCLVVLMGCGRAPQPLYPTQSLSVDSSIVGDQFDRAKTGSIRGTVVWEGPHPAPNSNLFSEIYPGDSAIRASHRNPLPPKIHPQGGVGDVMVYLRNVDPHQANPTPLPPVRVVYENRGIHIEQGSTVGSRFGFLRPGDTVEFVSRDPGVQILHGNGPSFFTLTFTEIGRPRTRSIPQKGILEISHAAGNLGAKAWLVIDDHPYYTRTNATGAYTFDQVPAGDYELVCRVPRWHVAKFERDPETCLPFRVWYHPPVEFTQPIQVRPGNTQAATLRVNLMQFDPPAP